MTVNKTTFSQQGSFLDFLRLYKYSYELILE